MLTFIIIYIFLCAIVATWAERKGHHGIGYWLLSVFVSPLIGAIVVACISNKTIKQCPYCRQWIDTHASICRFCGSKILIRKKTNTTTSNSTSTTNGITIQWHCLACGCTTNPDSSNFCTVCKEPRYSMKNLSENDKKIISEYIEKQTTSTDITEMKKIQTDYFENPSLKFMKLMLPDINEITDIEQYKNKLKEVTKENTIIRDDKQSNNDTKKESKTDDTTLEEELEKLKSLFEKNLIDEEEYKTKKAKLLGL